MTTVGYRDYFTYLVYLQCWAQGSLGALFTIPWNNQDLGTLQGGISGGNWLREHLRVRAPLQIGECVHQRWRYSKELWSWVIGERLISYRYTRNIFICLINWALFLHIIRTTTHRFRVGKRENEAQSSREALGVTTLRSHLKDREIGGILLRRLYWRCQLLVSSLNWWLLRCNWRYLDILWSRRDLPRVVENNSEAWYCFK